jgi:hypothetical protein
MNEMRSTIEEICAEVNKFIKIAVDDKTIDLQEISSRNYICILLDINLYDNPELVSSAFKLLVRYFTQKQRVIDLGTEV